MREGLQRIRRANENIRVVDGARRRRPESESVGRRGPVDQQQALLPYLSPDARYAFCPFDTADRAMRVHALLPDLGWTVGVYAPDGTNLYSAAASSERETTINLSIIPADDRFLGLSSEAPQTSDADQTIAAPKGFIVVRAPDRGDPYRTETQSVLEKASCSVRRT